MTASPHSSDFCAIPIGAVTLTTIDAVYRARTARSAALHDEAGRYFPGGVTRSVGLYQPYPVYIADGCGCRVRDVDGNEYLDHLNNFGSMIHGHANPRIVQAIREQAERGTDFGSPTELHMDLARELRRRVPSIDRIRFTASGTEAVLYAIRAARAFTNKQKILKFEGSYHGGYGKRFPGGTDRVRAIHRIALVALALRAVEALACDSSARRVGRAAELAKIRAGVERLAQGLADGVSLATQSLNEKKMSHSNPLA